MQFIVNNELIETKAPAGMSLLTFLRKNLNLCGSKVGCREGDCGACTVIVGNWESSGEVIYRTMVSCLMPLANCSGKHIVTIEGVSRDEPNAIQQALVDEGASQCGFCTPGFVLSMTAHLINSNKSQYADLYRNLDGNICRCTGYKSIERALNKIEHLNAAIGETDVIRNLIKTGILPGYFSRIPERLSEMAASHTKRGKSFDGKSFFVGGATDIMIQQTDRLLHEDIQFLSREGNQEISLEKDTCSISAITTIESLYASEVLAAKFPGFRENLHLFGSTSIRNMATIAGNIANASPIGDLTIMLLALDAELNLGVDEHHRKLPLDQFYLDYKKMNLRPGERILDISFKLPPPHAHFSFEKVSKRRILDIATVNSACLMSIDQDSILECRISAGGVAPVPLLLSQTSALLSGIKFEDIILEDILRLADEEIRPISDVRGTADYKRLLLRQFIIAHLQDILPQKQIYKILLSS